MFHKINWSTILASLLVLLVISTVFIMAAKKPKGITGYEVKVKTFDLEPRAVEQFQVSCTPGKKVLGGGVTSQGPVFTDLEVLGSYPDGASWNARVQNSGYDTVPIKVEVFAICADVAQ